MKKMNYKQVLRRLASYCSRAERCIWDIRKKMNAWEIPYEQQDFIVQYLQKEKYLDEARYCKAFVNDKLLYNRWGIYKIRFELKKKKIPATLIQQVLDSLNPEENIERLRLLIEQKKKTVTGKNDWEIRQKLLRFASSRGFSQEEAEKVLGTGRD